MTFKFNLQLFKGNTTQTTTYTASPEEQALLNQQLKYQEAFYPNVIRLNGDAGNLLWDSYGDVQADFGGMNSAAQQQIANGTNLINGLQTGAVPQQFTDNYTKAIAAPMQGAIGNVVNSLGNRNVLNSSVTNQALNDIQKNAAQAAAEQANNNISTVSQLGQQQIDNATAAMTTAAAAQEAAQQPALNLWNASLGLQQSGNSVLGNIAGKYGTSVSKQSTSGGGLGSLLGGAATGFLGGYTSQLGSNLVKKG